MQHAGKEPPGKGSLELVEEATQLVRTAPVAALTCYYVGTLPFVLAALFFWGDMSQSAFAGQHAVEAALGLSVLFIWMKYWQTRYAAQLRRMLTSSTLRAPGHPALANGSETARWSPQVRAVASQMALQPIGLFLISLALVVTVPFAWVYAFFQNLTVLAGAGNAPVFQQVRIASRLAKLWPKQNHAALLILFGFGFFVFFNLAMIGYLLPELAKMLFGIESVVTRSGATLLNSTFFAATAGLTYLCVDPLVKALYTLRCFYGESLDSGQDLKAELQQLSTPVVALLLVTVVLVGATTCSALPADNGLRLATPGLAPVQSTAASDGNVSPQDLDQAIRHTIEQRKYTWRAPREKIAEEQDADEGVLSRFFSRVRKLVAKWAKGLGDWLEKLLRKLFSTKRTARPSTPGYSWMIWSQMLQYILIAAAVVGLGLLAYKLWRDRHPRLRSLTTAQPMQAPPDLTDQNVGAEQLPEDGWIRLARELLGRGEWRLALRAFYLASLAHLAERHLISLAKFKSNREYERELRRRAHAQPELLTCFAQSVSVFERVWYGSQAIDADLVQEFAANVDRVKANAGT